MINAKHKSSIKNEFNHDLSHIKIIILISCHTLLSIVKQMLHSAFARDIEDIADKKEKSHFDTVNIKQIAVIKTLIMELHHLDLGTDIEHNRELLTKLIVKYDKSIAKRHLISVYEQMILDGEIGFNINMHNVLIKKLGKSSSGIVSITVVTSPGRFSCTQDCHYCPNEPGMPRSYVSTGPSLLRARRVDFDVVKQFRDRAMALSTMGHEITKIEIIVLGGTWSYHPIDYQLEFITGIYFAANTFEQKSDVRPMMSLEEEIEINRNAKARIIGLTLETRPDCINPIELERFRRYGVTRVQLGIQHIDDEILEAINRKCPTYKTEQAIKLLKENCFKVDGHFMPDLPFSSFEKDKQMFEFLFSDKNTTLQVDQMKIYPTMVTQYTTIEKWYKSGLYKPYGDLDDCKLLFNLLVQITTTIPSWIRLNRIVRDIPSGVIIGKFKESNLYQHVLKYMKDNHLRGRDIRFREVKNAIVKHEDCQMFRESYVSSEGKEYFISFETKDRQSLLGFIRVRINDNPTCSVFTDLHNAVLIRELHVYGKLVKQDDAAKFGSVQHMGIGKRLLAEARQLAIDMGYSKLAVIAGVGTTQYYQKQGFALSKNKGSYMIKQLVVVPRIAKSMFCIFAKTISIVNFVFQSRSYCDDICALM